MSVQQHNDDPALPKIARFRFRLAHLFYGIALIGSSLGLFGPAGLTPGLIILAAWTYIFSRASRPRALLEVLVFCFIASILAGLFLPSVQSAREAAPRSACANQLRQIMLALHNYHDEYNSLPPAYVPDKSGKPMHSWRVLILPYIEKESLYNLYNFDEPWDGPNNRKLAGNMPLNYVCPIHRRPGLTQSCYSVIVGPHTTWPGAHARSFSEIIDGTSNTVFVIEAPPRGVNWMEPKDLTVDEALQVVQSEDGGHRQEDFFYVYPYGRNVGTGDAAVHFVTNSMPKAAWVDVLTIDDGAAADWHEHVGYQYQHSAVRQRHLKVGNCIRLAIFVLFAVLPLPWVWINQHRPEELDS